MYTTAICVGVLGLLVILLGLNVSMVRGATSTSIGYNPDPTDRLYKAVRAHGNATEYNPMLAILILVLGMREPAAWLLWVFAATALVRVLHAAGMLLSPSLAKAQPLRFVGALGTYVLGTILGAVTVLGAGSGQ